MDIKRILQDGKWLNLSKPPVITAIFQLKFEEDVIAVKDFLSYHPTIHKDFPNRKDNIAANININSSSNIPIPLGKAPLKGFSEAKVTSYLYYSEDQKEKLEVSSEGITYINEKPYEGWDTFKEKVLKYISVYADILNNITIKRTSIRFINRFELAEFDDPSVYFNTAISSINGDESLPYSLQKYGFKMTFDIKEGINAVVNQNVDKRTDCYIYIFDIDVLDWNNLIYNAESFVKILENLRYIKNKIFFSNITEKIIELCN